MEIKSLSLLLSQI